MCTAKTLTHSCGHKSYGGKVWTCPKISNKDAPCKRLLNEAKVSSPCKDCRAKKRKSAGDGKTKALSDEKGSGENEVVSEGSESRSSDAKDEDKPSPEASALEKSGDEEGGTVENNGD